MKRELIFVYNANSGRWNGYIDILHKIFSPKTYPCSLCATTHGIFKIREEWAQFIKNPPVPMRFLHKNEELPAVFLAEGKDLSVWISCSELNVLGLQELKKLVNDRFL
jgi:hypothetical protein